MKNKLFRDGDSVRVFLEGGWEIEGLVQEESEKKVILKDSSGDIVILFKKKICGAKIMIGEKQAVQVQPYVVQPPPVTTQTNNVEAKAESTKMVFAVSKGRKGEQKKEDAENPYYFESGLSIPLGIVDGRPPGVTISLDDDFQMSMDQLNSIGAGSSGKKISFLVQEDE